MINRVSPSQILSLKENEIFVFGSNLAGRHGAGAAKLALKWGAEWGKGYGLQGNTYAIPTKNREIKILSLLGIYGWCLLFFDFCRHRSDLTFLVTEIGCGLAGYDPEQVAPLFKEAMEIENIHLPQRFWAILGN